VPGDGWDVLIVGAGVFGLWCARACAQAGLTVVLAEQGVPGAGASGGLVGALTPHPPARWSPLKQQQLDALLTLGPEIAALEAETGCATGYARVGRLTPIPTAEARVRATDQIAGAAAHWGGHAHLSVLDRPRTPVDLLDPAQVPHGLIHDTLSARIEPRAYLDALRAALTGRVALRCGWTLRSLVSGGAVFDCGEIRAGAVVLAAGWRTPALAGLLRGGGVKGQAALLAADMPETMPVIAARGLYIVSRGPGRVAVGSTSETEWSQAGPDAALDAVLARASALCPRLAGAPVVERWAGIRPRAPRPGPMVGPLAGRQGVFLATGGHGIGLALAHRVGRLVAGVLTGDGPPLPVEWLPERHLAD
jgi:glycine/D-amino acid oxidase-like deaminating enzyme